jgi:RNA recognition motif-containing protein
MSDTAKEEAVYASLKNLNSHLQRIYFMRDKSVNLFLGYAFAEFSTEESAQGALGLISSLPSFSLCGKPVEISFGRDLTLK